MTREQQLEACLLAILTASGNTKVKKFYGMITTVLGPDAYLRSPACEACGHPVGAHHVLRANAPPGTRATACAKVGCACAEPVGPLVGLSTVMRGTER